MPSAPVFSVLGAGIGYLALWLAIWFTHDPKEPPVVFNSIPFLSPIFGIIEKRWRFFMSLRDQCGLAICTLRLPFVRCYIINDTALIPSVDRQIKIISFAPIEANATAGFLGTTEETNRIMRLNPTSDDGHFQSFHKAIRPALGPGPGLDNMLSETFKAMESSLNRQSKYNSAEFDLFQWVRHQIILATTTGEYGPRNPFLNPAVEQAWYDFVPGVRYFVIGLFPKLFARKSFEAREFLSKAFEYYFEEGHHLEGASASALARTEHGITKGLPLSDRARGEVGFAMSLVNNTVPSTFWLIYHIFSNPAILEECRQELYKAVKVEHDGTHTLDLSDVIAHCPLLISTLNEVYRYHGVGTTLIRQVTEDHMLNGTYLLKKGNFVIMPTSVQHYSQGVWGPDVNIFNHRRFVQEHVKGRTGPDPSKRHNPDGFRVFGGGALLCPGRHFANNSILAFAALVILRFDIRPVASGWESVRVENSFGMNVARMLLQPENDLRVEMASTPSRIRTGDKATTLRVQLSRPAAGVTMNDSVVG
ncbi:cytochrome P450 oxidoreductase [Annulohypoxylon nitens]|nr:cytochrome P450 oxidoreductase [Annulohypoxylon nitens]